MTSDVSSPQRMECWLLANFALRCVAAHLFGAGIFVVCVFPSRCASAHFQKVSLSRIQVFVLCVWTRFIFANLSCVALGQVHQTFCFAP